MLELQNICYRVSTPEGEMDILRDISITIPDQRLMVFTDHPGQDHHGPCPAHVRPHSV